MIEAEQATAYGDFEQERVLHQSRVRMPPNGWSALPAGRLIPSHAVHHVDQ